MRARLASLAGRTETIMSNEEKRSMKVALFGFLVLAVVPGHGAEQNAAMSDAYWKIWNPEVQSRIDRDIEQHRKADGNFVIDGVAAGAEVQVEQLTHDFFFGANIFNFDQLGTPDLNRKYKELFGTLFNSATIPFYWKKFEMEPNHPRFRAEERDTEAYWNAVAEPKEQPHWRRPATDPIVAFCENQKIRLHGHPMIWGNRRWHHPDWLFDEFCPADEKEKILGLGTEGLAKSTPAEIAELAPVFTREMRRLFEQRVVQLAEYYGDRIHSWDVVNESATDYARGAMIPGDAICKSHYGLMPGDYTYHAFKTADRMLPKSVVLNINDYLNNERYAEQTRSLLARGCRIDVLGSQMHLFNPQQCLDIADGKPILTPDSIWRQMETLATAGLPIHLSEITITSPGNDERGKAIQAVIARNLYRLWFSIEPMMGITWWNVVDDCGAPGEPSISGLCTRDMESKPSFHALNELINDQWKTRTTVKAGKDGAVAFRGFRGRYRLTWTGADGNSRQTEVHLGGNP
jgi:endo-1,4-beta-xylanase